MHWTNWRVIFPVTAGHQAGVAREIMDEIAQGRLVQLLVTNWPKPELNHTVVAYEFREDAAAIEFLVWDPNDPASPGRLTFDRQQSRFLATRIYDTEPGPSASSACTIRHGSERAGRRRLRCGVSRSPSCRPA